MESWSTSRNRLGSLNRAPHGFTLVELLVVLAIISLLAALVLPVLSKAKAKGDSISCLNQERQLIGATFIYVGDNNDLLPNNYGVEGTRKTVEEGRFLNWVNNVMSWDLERENTNTLLLTTGGLGPYLSSTPKIYRCPADSALSEIQRDAGWRNRVRSYSMNAMMGNAGEFTRGGTNVNNPGYEQFFKLGQIPAPSQIFIYIEEHPDSIGDAYFLNRAYTGEWNDLPASYHNGSANVAFADGHVENHRWRFSHTKPPNRPDAALLPKKIPAGEEEDFAWVMERTSRKRYYKSK